MVLLVPEHTYAVSVGVGREDRQVAANRPNMLQERSRTSGYGKHVLGAVGECGVAKYLGVPWVEAEILTPGGRADVAGYGVRARGFGQHDLPIRPGDKHPQVCTTVAERTVTVHGWYDVAEARAHPEWKEDKGDYGVAAYWVPHDLLHPMTSVPMKGEHLHGWYLVDGVWLCARCSARYVGPVPVDAEHPDGYQR